MDDTKLALWQRAVDSASAALAARDLERAEAEAREAERAEIAALWSACPEPSIVQRVERWPHALHPGQWCGIWHIKGSPPELVWQVDDRPTVQAPREHPIREEAVRLWKAAWVERVRQRRAADRIAQAYMGWAGTQYGFDVAKLTAKAEAPKPIVEMPSSLCIGDLIEVRSWFWPSLRVWTRARVVSVDKSVCAQIDVGGYGSRYVLPDEPAGEHWRRAEQP